MPRVLGACTGLCLTMERRSPLHWCSSLFVNGWIALHTRRSLMGS